MYIDISIYICFLFGHKQTVLLKKGTGRVLSPNGGLFFCCFLIYRLNLKNLTF